MPPIGTSRVDLIRNTEPIGVIGVTSRSRLESKIEASEAASTEDTRQKELFYSQTSPSTSVGLFYFNKIYSFYPEACAFLVRLRTLNKKNQITPSL